MDNKYFFEWYQEPLTELLTNGDESIMRLFSQFVKGMYYDNSWAQQCLDFSYRVIKSNLCKIVANGEDDIEILLLLSNYSVNEDGAANWYVYQFYLSDFGEKFLKESGLNEDMKEFSPLFKEKLTKLFEEHGVGFDKSNFIPVQF